MKFPDNDKWNSLRKNEIFLKIFGFWKIWRKREVLGEKALGKGRKIR